MPNNYKAFCVFLCISFLLFVSPNTIFAQISIGKFYSQGTYKNKPLDWVEIVNNSDSQVNLKNYAIKDSNLSETNTYEFEGDTFLGSGQSCIKEVGQILNKDEDIIYIFNGVNQIYCLEYGSNTSDCNKASDLGLDPQNPVAHCSTSTPTPTQAPTKQPTPNSKPTPVPAISTISTTEPAPSPTPHTNPSPAAQVKGTAIKSSPEPDIVNTEEETQPENNQSNWLGYPLIASGFATSGYGIFLLRGKIKDGYNEGYGKLKED